ncbi:nucleotidyltransferase domain-containing protein [Rhodococcus sp. NPDC077669]|uniref:nucleotidyltransferase family protein n=1 Tax=Rhodococcus sp. NPDC077669 TaxID=3155174 RepID=UPI003418FB2D
MPHTVDELALPLGVDELRAVLRRYGVIEASVFGSYARGSARVDSDLDLLVTFGPDCDDWAFLCLQDELDQLLSGSADVVTNLNKHFRRYIEPDLVRIL